MADKSGKGIAIERLYFKDFRAVAIEEAKQSHREDGHSFFLLEKGTVSVEIDFQKHTIKSPAIIYMHPNQVHRIVSFNKVTVSSWFINNENLRPEYLRLLEDIAPAKPLPLTKEAFAVLAEAAALCMRLFNRNSSKLHHSIIRDGCNTLVVLAVSLLSESIKTKDNPARYETVTRLFMKLLEQNYTKLKRPNEYAQRLTVSTPYLNECVKSTTGFPVSYHIQQRNILEAKRLLYYSRYSVKEIAAALGYDDYPYFSRLFTRVSGMTALAFRSKNLD
ncbi:MAG: helix-turn-helix domain-containing protein [Williamsia sp.]|nr:helix-turn-helix domain-containing protein [Williamsia sp.]